MQPKINKTNVTTYNTIHENKGTVLSKSLCLHNLGFLIRIKTTSS